MFAYPYNSKFSNFSLCFVTFPGTLLEQVTSRALKDLVCWENSTSWSQSDPLEEKNTGRLNFSLRKT